MKPEIIAIFSIYLFFGILEFWRTNLFNKKNQQTRDLWFEGIASIVLLLITQPMILLLASSVGGLIVPQWAGALSSLNFFAAFALFLIFDDMMQYWWHRACHTFPWLYPFHRPHHDAEYMSVRIVYRNNLFFYLFMPSLWFSGLLIYLGLGWVYSVFIILKMAIIIGAHSDVRWDAPLYKIKWMSPVMWLVERTISTPATHFAHHGKYKSDGVTHYKGNYGNMLFFWDVLFGTAKITRQYPTKFGVENLPPTSIGEQLVWPIIRYKHAEERPSQAE